jgi:multimeric flavodoxin WrbA
LKLLILKSNPRKEGFTEHCVKLFIEGVKDAGVDPEIIDLTSISMDSCKGCFKCWTVTPGKCVQEDDVAGLLQKFLECEGIVMASPLYAYAVSSSLKKFLERTLPLLAPGVNLNDAGRDHNKLRYPDKGPRKMAVILAGGLKDSSHCAGAVESLRLYAEGFGMEFCGALIRPESFFIQFVDTKPRTIKTIETAFVKAGRVFATEGMIGETIRHEVNLPLAPDLKVFENYSNVYWEYASKGYDMEELRRLTEDDIRIMISEMALNFDPVITRDVRNVIQFSFPDKGMDFYLKLDMGKCTHGNTAHDSPDLTIICSSVVWTEIVHRKKDPLKALTTRELVLKGDRSLFRKLPRYFPPPSS